MSDCCTPGIGFPNASTMQQMATNLPLVWSEICMIQQAIMSAASLCSPTGGKMCTIVAGNTPMTFVTGVLSVNVADGGEGYMIDSPLLEFVPPYGVTPSVQATADIIRNNGAIGSIDITNPGQGYQPVSSTLNVSSISGTGASVEPLVNALGEIETVAILAPGTGYAIGDTVIPIRAVSPNPAYVDASFEITQVGVLGEILSISVLNRGTGYQDSVTTTRIISSLNSSNYPQGAGFIGSVLTNPAGEILGVEVNNSGVGYFDIRPYLTITDPGTGATTYVNLTGDAVSSINVLTSGSSYTSAATGSVLNPPTAPMPITEATVFINVAENTFGTNPNLYWQTWSGAATNKQLQLQMNQVLSHFKSLGYGIEIQTNPNTGSTIQWKVSW